MGFYTYFINTRPRQNFTIFAFFLLLESHSSNQLLHISRYQGVDNFYIQPQGPSLPGIKSNQALPCMLPYFGETIYEIKLVTSNLLQCIQEPEIFKP